MRYLFFGLAATFEENSNALFENPGGRFFRGSSVADVIGVGNQDYLSSLQ